MLTVTVNITNGRTAEFYMVRSVTLVISITLVLIPFWVCSGIVVEALRYNRKVAGSIPNGVTGFLHDALWPWGRLSLYQKWVPGIFPGGKGSQCVGLTTLPPSCANCLKIWEPQSPGILRACQGLYWNCFTFTFTFTLLIPFLYFLIKMFPY
jgi:hypothetical protein